MIDDDGSSYGGNVIFVGSEKDIALSILDSSYRYDLLVNGMTRLV